MSTFVRLHIYSENQFKLVGFFKEFANIDEITIIGVYPKKRLAKSVLLDETKDPDFIAIEPDKNGWTTVHVNSFKKLHTWLEAISKLLDTTVIQIIGQTDRDKYYFLMYHKGGLEGEIEINNDADHHQINLGETKHSASGFTNAANVEDYENIYDRDTLANYCKKLGFALVSNNDAESYTLLYNKQTIAPKALDDKENKPWWKFW